SRSATAATRSGSAVFPTQSTASPPARTSGRHHSAATGGGASAFATATPAQSTPCSSAPPRTTRAFGGAQRSRKAALRRPASSRTNSSSGSASESAVSPGVATTARSQSSSGPDDDVAIRLLALAHRLDAAEALQALVHALPLERAHRRELDRAAVADGLLRGANGERLERAAAAVAVARSVDDDLLPLLAAGDDRTDDRLHRVDRLSVLADQEPEIAAGAGDGDGVGPLGDRNVAADTHRRRHVLEHRANASGERRLVDRRRRGRPGEHAGRRDADPEQAAVALAQHLEPHRRAVECRRPPLELPQRIPRR